MQKSKIKNASTLEGVSAAALAAVKEDATLGQTRIQPRERVERPGGKYVFRAVDFFTFYANPSDSGYSNEDWRNLSVEKQKELGGELRKMFTLDCTSVSFPFGAISRNADDWEYADDVDEKNLPARWTPVSVDIEDFMLNEASKLVGKTFKVVAYGTRIPDQYPTPQKCYYLALED